MKIGINPSSISEKPTGASDANFDAWLSPGRFALILGILIVAFFPDVVFTGKGFVLRDFGIFTYPNAYFQRESLWRGELPLWNPLNCSGIPFLAQWNTVCLYPLSLLYVLLPLAWGLKLFMLLHLFLAGLGMYLLASRWTGNRLAAAVAGTAFTFNGMTLNCLMWCSNLAALAWMPWVVLLVEQAWVRGGKRPIILAALAGAAQMLSGAPEIVVLTWLILFALWIARLVCAKDIRWNTSLRVILVGGIITLLSAVQLLPFFDLLAHSERTSAYGTSLWSIPLWGWANLFVPLFHCYKSPVGVYFQPSQDWTSSYYLGAGALALAVIAVFRIRGLRVWLLAAFAVFGFVVALGDGGHVYPFLLKVFPPLGFMRFPIKFAFLSVFSVPLLAAFGIAHLQDGRQLARAWKWAVGMAALFCATIGGILWYAHIHPSPDEYWPLLFGNGALRAIFLVLIFGAVLAAGRIQDSRKQLLMGLFLILCVWFDVATHAPNQNPTTETSIFEPGLLTQRMSPAPKPGESRAFMTKQSHDLFYSSMLTELNKDYIGRRCVLFGDCNILDDIPTPDGFYSLYIKEQHSLFTSFFASPTNAFPAGFSDFLAISEISDPEKIATWLPRPSSLPLYSIGAKPEFVQLSETPALLLAKDFDPRKTVYLPAEAKSLVGDIAATQGTIYETHFTAQRVELDVAAEAPTVLVLSQTYYHPWRVYVDDKSTGVLRANYAFQAVAIPAGSHHVKFVYEDRRFSLGVAISIVTLGGCLFMVFFRRREGVPVGQRG